MKNEDLQNAVFQKIISRTNSEKHSALQSELRQRYTRQETRRHNAEKKEHFPQSWSDLSPPPQSLAVAPGGTLLIYFGGCFGSELAVHRGYYWQCTQESLLAVPYKCHTSLLVGPYQMPAIETGSTAFKASALPAILSLCPPQ